MRMTVAQTTPMLEVRLQMMMGPRDRLVHGGGQVHGGEAGNTGMGMTMITTMTVIMIMEVRRGNRVQMRMRGCRGTMLNHSRDNREREVGRQNMIRDTYVQQERRLGATLEYNSAILRENASAEEVSDEIDFLL